MRMVFVINGVRYHRNNAALAARLRTKLFPIPYLPTVFDQHGEMLFLPRIAFQS